MYVLVRIGLSRFSTPFTADFGPSGLAWRGRRGGAQLDGEFAFYASRRRLRACPGGGGPHNWTEILLSTPLAADFGPGPEEAAEGRAAGRGILFYASRHRLRASGPGLDGAVEGCAALAWNLPFYLSLTGLSTGGQAMIGHWSQHHLRL